MQFDRKYIPDHILKQLYKNLLLTRLIEEKMIAGYDEGKIGNRLCGFGQEAIAVGAALALEADEWLMADNKNIGVFVTRSMPLKQLLMRDRVCCSKGRDGTFNFISKDNYVSGKHPKLSSQMAVANGVALSYKLRKQQKVSIAFTCAQDIIQTDYEAALQSAFLWDLPVIFLIQNNLELSEKQVNGPCKKESFIDIAKRHEIEGIRIDGNNVLTVYDTIRGVREHCFRNQKSYVVEGTTMTFTPIEFANTANLIPKELFVRNKLEDPVKSYENYLLSQKLFKAADIEKIKIEFEDFIEAELDAATLVGNGTDVMDVYAPTSKIGEAAKPLLNTKHSNAKKPAAIVRSIKMQEAINEGLSPSIQEHENLVVIVQESDQPCKLITGDSDCEKLYYTSSCVSALVGVALGLSLENYKTVLEISSLNVASLGFSRLLNDLAGSYYTTGQSADVVIRVLTGTDGEELTIDQQGYEAWLIHTPGLKVVYPSNPADAKGLLIASINDPNPVVFFEHKALYETIGEVVPEALYEIELGKAKQVQSGDDVSIITYGLAVKWAVDYATDHPEISINILDLRTLLPFDYEAIRAAVSKTGKVLILHEDTLTGGVGAELSAWIGEYCFNMLDAPVMRCASLDTPVPFNKNTRETFSAHSRLHSIMQKLLNW